MAENLIDQEPVPHEKADRLWSAIEEKMDSLPDKVLEVSDSKVVITQGKRFYYVAQLYKKECFLELVTKIGPFAHHGYHLSETLDRRKLLSQSWDSGPPLTTEEMEGDIEAFEQSEPVDLPREPVQALLWATRLR